jgi:predicted phage terminase large subunit-like protein
MWHVHHPATPLLWNWHIDCLAEHLEAVYSGQIQRIAINVPPGFVKSLMVSVYFPAWVWTHAPAWQFLCTAAAADVVLRDARRHREICASPEYRDIYQVDWGFLRAQDAKGYFQTEAGGYRISRTTGQAMTGLRGDCLMMDDPLDASKAYSDKTQLMEVNQWRDTVFSTRKNSPTSREVLIQQRLHEMDMTGHLMQKDAGEWFLLCLPMEYDPKRVFVSPIGRNDPRTEEGELLFPAFVSPKQIEQIKHDIGEAAYSAQYQQRPVPEQGTVFKRSDFRYWIPPGTVIEWKDDDPTRALTVELPEIDARIASCDFNRLEQHKHTRGTDYAVIDLWGTHGRDRFLLQQVRQKMGLGASIIAVRQLYEHHPDLFKTLIEKSANGPSVIAAVQAECEGVEGVSVQGESKIQRAGAVAPVVEQGRVYLPHPYLWPWVEYWLEEVCGFPGRRRDDRVDAFTMAIIWIEKNLTAGPFSFSL